ncbi:MAG: hypothetical protein FJY85_15915 [Deltaproteobacteria bacterium]|nr:hypothetical protein [Deltaproteobacteria bacterium]
MRQREADKRVELREKISAVAQELGFPDRVTITHLAIALDREGITPVRSGRWIDPLGLCYPAKLKQFLAWHLPELLVDEPTMRRFGPTLQPPAPVCPVSQLDVAVTQAVTQPVTQPEELNCADWTLHQDNHGFWRAHKRINGKVRTVYIGRDPSQSAEKIERWHRRQDDQTNQ